MSAPRAVDPDLGLEVEVRIVHPYRALKPYRCPGCGHAIRPGTGHFVVVPIEAADLRRHWHRPCWERAVRVGTAQ
ncbi:MAG TPA: hypothetical protein VNY84_01890 [Acidimicrobiales bacterium]|nr:hypothetical protein [Acidimicrobiales bacterium]